MKARFEMFSDGVFAIAITLLILEIRVPAHDEPLVPALLQLWPSYVAYVAGFLSIGIYWVGHHVVTHYLERIDGGSLFLNLILLMTIAFIPFPTAVLADRIAVKSEATEAAVFYGIANLLPALVAIALLSYARRHGLLRWDDYAREAPVALTRYAWVGAIISAVGIAACFVSAAAGLAIFVSSSLFWGYVNARWRPRHPQG